MRLHKSAAKGRNAKRGLEHLRTDLGSLDCDKSELTVLYFMFVCLFFNYVDIQEEINVNPRNATTLHSVLGV